MDTRTMVAGLAAAVLALTAGVSQARDIFFDTFSGNQLRPHWQQPPPRHWEHTVADSRLTVSGLFHPGVPGQPNVASIAAEFAPVMRDVTVVTADLGWEPGDGRSLSVRLFGPSGFVGAMGYEEVGGVQRVFLQGPPTAPPPFTAPAPPPGTHRFQVMRTPDYSLLSVNGEAVLVFGGTGFEPLSRVEVAFAGTEGIRFASLNVDHVRVVPASPTVPTLLCAICVFVHRRRPAWQDHGKTCRTSNR